MANKVTTEWFDAQVKFGNYLPNEKESTLYEQQQAMQEQHAEDNTLQKVLDKKTNEQIEDMEDDLDCDDQFYKEYMAKRMAEISALAKKAKYGSVFEISRDEYVRQVTEADPESFVVLHLYQGSVQWCNLINQWLVPISAKYPLVKFIKIVADKCIENFPQSKCPCIIVYRGGKLVSNSVNVDKYLDAKKVESLEAFLMTLGVFNFELQKEEINAERKDN